MDELKAASVRKSIIEVDNSERLRDLDKDQITTLFLSPMVEFVFL